MSRVVLKTPMIVVLLALCGLPAAAFAGTCGVLPFSAGEGVNRGAAPNITALVSSELDIRGGYELVIAAPAEDFEGGDCGASTSCIKEFGKANKHEAVVAGRVESLSDDEYSLTLTLHNGSTASVIREVKRTVPSSALALAGAVTGVVVELVTGDAPDDDGDGAASSDGPLFDDVDFDELLDEADQEVASAPSKRKRSRAAPSNPDRDDRELDLDDDEDPFGIDELDALDMSAEQIEKKKKDRARQAELDRIRQEEEEQQARARAEEERQRRLADERERKERAQARAEREEREQEARAEAERRDERERRARAKEEREREEREQARAQREEREREERERQARADREERERRASADRERSNRQRDEDERQARADREQREREERARDERRREPEPEPDDEIVLGSALALGPASGILIGGDDDDDDEYTGGIVIGAADDDEYDDYEVEDDEPREGMIIGDDDEPENPSVRRRREAEENREAEESRESQEGSSDRYSRARTFGGSSSRSGSARSDRDDDYARDDDATASSDDEDLIDLDEDERDGDRDYDDRSYDERSYGSERVASRDDRYLADDYSDETSRAYRAGRGTTAKSKVSRSDTASGNRPWFSARVSGGYTNYYLHFAQYGVDLGFFPVPRVSVDFQADFWTLSIRECPDCEQQYRTLPSFYLGGSYRFTNLKVVQPYVGGDVGTVVYAIGTLTDAAGQITRRPLMGVAFEVKGGADFMFTRNFGVSAGVKAGLAYASKVKENVHPDWNPLQFLINVRVAAVVQF